MAPKNVGITRQTHSCTHPLRGATLISTNQILVLGIFLNINKPIWKNPLYKSLQNRGKRREWWVVLLLLPTQKRHSTSQEQVCQRPCTLLCSTTFLDIILHVEEKGHYERWTRIWDCLYFLLSNLLI